jgi:hypothetical protein
LTQVLKKFNLDSVYEGQTKVDGEHFMIEDVDDGPGAFRACLDVGLARTSTGAKVNKIVFKFTCLELIVMLTNFALDGICKSI